MEIAEEDIYNQLERAQLRDLIRASQSPSKTTFAILVILQKEINAKDLLKNETFVANTDGDLAQFCEDVIGCFRTFPLIEGSNERQDSLLQKPCELHFIFSEHPHCLWKHCVDIIGKALNANERKVTVHSFSEIWTKHVEVIQD